MIYILTFLVSSAFVWIGTRECTKRKMEDGMWETVRLKKIPVLIGLLLPALLASMRAVSVGSDVSFYVVPLFNKAIKEQLVLIDDMISEKDFSQKNFTDKEIILMLPDSSEGQIFSTYNDNSGFYKKASIENVEKSAKKLFNKTIDINSIQNGNSIRVINNDVIVEVRSGVGVLNAELISINSINDNEYIIEFKFTSGSDTAEIYKLTVNYNQGNVIYENFEK